MRPGDFLGGRFHIESLAGAGGMGVVYRARDVETGAVVAVKTLADGNHAAPRFEREAQVLAKLQHPGIVSYLAHGIHAGAIYLVMEWLDGEDLERRLRRAPVEPDAAVAIVSALADALGAAHALGIVHRDVKPGNVFLVSGKPPRVKLLDFGVARGGSSTPMTQTGAAIGTPSYMAPEQARGERGVDARADVFSLGCVLFECLAGRPPFVGAHALGVMLKIVLEEAPRLRQLLPEAAPALDDLVDRMLSKDPLRRPTDARAVAAELALLERPDGRSSARPVITHAGAAPRTLSRAERRIVSVVLLGPPDDKASGAPVDQLGPTLMSSDPLVARLRAMASAAEVAIEPLLDGSVVAVLSAAGAPTDRAVRAAMLAMAMRHEAAGRAIAVAMGRAEPGETLRLGEVLDRAARLVADARTGETRLDDATTELLRSRFVVVSRDGGHVLLGQREDEEPRTLLGRPTACLGRDSEVAMLDAWLSQCLDEPRARAVLVTGPPGIGKSRLRSELLRRFSRRTEPLEVWGARGDPTSAGSSFGIAAQLVRAAARLKEAEPLPVRRSALLACIGEHIPAPRGHRVAEFLGEMVGASFPDEESVELRAARRDALLMGDQMRRAWSEFVATECAVRPVVILLEDLQWGDAPSVELVDDALREQADRPLFVLAFGRPEVEQEFPRLWADRELQSVRLGALPRKAAEQLVRDALGASVAADAVAGLVDRAAGNAFYLEELIRSSADGRTDAMPQTVLAMVETRIASLEPEARRALRAASIFGEVFRAGAVLALTGGGLGSDVAASTSADWIDVLVRREFIVRRGTQQGGERELEFRHAIVRDAAYAMLTIRDRTLGHQLAAGWLEGAGDTDALRVAQHFELGGAPDRAIPWWTRAAEQALEANDLTAAIDRATRGVGCGAALAAKARLLVLQAIAEKWLLQREEAAGHLREALGLFARGDEEWLAALGELALVCAPTDLPAMTAELRAVAPIPATPTQLLAHARITISLYLAESGLATELSDGIASLDALGAAPMADPAVAARVFIGRGIRARAEAAHDRGIADLVEAIRCFESIGDLRSASLQRVNVARAYNDLGEHQRAESLLRLVLAGNERAGVHRVVLPAWIELARVLRARGESDEAEELVTRAVQEATRVGRDDWAQAWRALV